MGINGKGKPRLPSTSHIIHESHTLMDVIVVGYSDGLFNSVFFPNEVGLVDGNEYTRDEWMKALKKSGKRTKEIVSIQRWTGKRK